MSEQENAKNGQSGSLGITGTLPSLSDSNNDARILEAF